MRVEYRCSDCRQPVEAAASAGMARGICRGCGAMRDLDCSAAAPGGILERCACCRGEELYVRKDFPQRVGLVIVVAAGLLSFVLLGRGYVEWAVGVLVAVLLIDLLIYRFIPAVTVCYRCGAAHRGVKPGPAHGGFDLATAEKYQSPP